MARKEIVLDAAGGTRLIEVRHDMPRGLSVSRYRLSMPGMAATREFMTLRKARAAFRAHVAQTPTSLPARTEDA